MEQNGPGSCRERSSIRNRESAPGMIRVEYYDRATRDNLPGRTAVGQFESRRRGNVHVAGMVRRLGLAVLIGLLAVGTFVVRRHPPIVEPPPSPQRPHVVIAPRLGPLGLCLLQPSGSLRCSQEPPWG